MLRNAAVVYGLVAIMLAIFSCLPEPPDLRSVEMLGPPPTIPVPTVPIQLVARSRPTWQAREAVAERATVGARWASEKLTATASPVFGLMGRLTWPCKDGRPAINVAVDSAEITRTTDGETWVIVVMKIGGWPERPALLAPLPLVDNAGRTFSYRSPAGTFDRGALLRRYRALDQQETAEGIRGTRQVWTYVVAADATNLRFGPGTYKLADCPS
jgi:hypothetical protein